MTNVAASPVCVEDIQGDGRWMSQHKHHVEDCLLKKPQVLFVGDSLIQHMEHTETWDKLVQPLNAVNTGIGGDSTQHVLWRLQNGILKTCKPMVAIVFSWYK